MGSWVRRVRAFVPRPCFPPQVLPNRFGSHSESTEKKRLSLQRSNGAGIATVLPEPFDLFEESGGPGIATSLGMRRYQDFTTWQLARDLSRRVFDMTSTGPASRDFKFRDNMRDAADSAQRNFSEGFGRFSPGDFAHFLDHSPASLLEVQNAVGEGLARKYFREEECLEANALVSRTLKALSGLQQYLRSDEAKQNAKRARARHIARRAARTSRT